MTKSLCISLGLGLIGLGACQSSPSPAPPPAGGTAPSALLTRYNLAPLLQRLHQRERDTLGYAYQGFLGPTHRRIELVFTEVRRDSARPATYFVRGATRCRSIITSFTGTVTFAQVVEQPRYVSRSRVSVGDGTVQYPRTGVTCNECAMHTAVGRFELCEAATARNYGTYRGRVALDWQAQPPNELRIEYRTDSTLTRGGGIRFDGRWQNDSSELTQAVTWVRDIEGFANTGAAPLPELVFNGNNPQYNPRYAQLGWSGYLYTQDYWWKK